MNGHGKSDSPIVPVKSPNKALAAAIGAEVVEERGLAKGNTDSTTRPEHSVGPGVPSGLDRVREAERKERNARFTALLHHVDLDRLWMAYWAISPEAAPGVDGGHGRTTGRTWRATSKTCTPECIAAFTGRNRLGGCTSRRLTGRSGRSASHRWRIGSSSGQSSSL